jgi:hypothetical protein
MPSTPSNPERQLSAPELRELAVAAEVDPRTIQRVLAGERVVALPRMRIMRVLRERGLEHLLVTR